MDDGYIKLLRLIKSLTLSIRIQQKNLIYDYEITITWTDTLFIRVGRGGSDTKYS